MISEYFKTTIRSLGKNKLISSINIIGLAISLSAFIFISRYVVKELSYDQGHPNYERVYRVAELIESEDYMENSSSSPMRTGELMLQEFPDVIENQVRFFDFQTPVVTITLPDQRKFNENHTYFTDSSVFEMLDFNVVDGDPKTALIRPLTAAISQELATKYFGEENPIGKKISRDQLQNIEITAVFEQGSISHIQANMLLSWSTFNNFGPNFGTNMVWNPAWTYIRLAENATVEDLEQNKFPIMVDKYYDPRSKAGTSHYLIPISDVHLKSHLEFEMSPNSDIKYVYIFISCAFFLILIAMVNFINLSTSFSLLRAKEIGVRKVNGATKSQLVFQFLSESVIISMIAFVLSLLICIASFGFLQGLIDLKFEEVFNFQNLGFQLVIVFIIGLVSGIYPAFFISSFDPLLVFKGKFISNAKGQLLRKGLVISQFTIAIVLIVFTSITYKQLQFLNSKDYGYKSDNIILLDAANTPLGQRLEAFKGALKGNSSIQNITVMSDVIGTNNNNHDFQKEGDQAGEWNFYPALMVDEDFIETMDLEIIAGRDLDRSYAKEDSLAILINKTMVKSLGYTTPEEALGKKLWSRNGAEKIVGVVNDFNYKSLHSEIGPFALDIPRRFNNGFFFFRHVAVSVSDINQNTLSHIQTVWEEFVPNKPFGYKILDEELKGLYKSENNLGKILGIFAVLTIIIACLGLFALATFIAQQKTKEIGIRKVLGAGSLLLFYVGYKEQLFLILASLLISIPIGYFLVDRWLGDFAYRVDIGITPFALAGLLALVISAITVFSNFYKTITADPANVLRDE